MRAIRRSAVPLTLLLPSFVFYLVFALIPIVNTAQLSLFKWDGFSDEMPFVGGQNYTTIFTDSTFWQALWRNVEWTVMTLVLAVGFALVLAAILARLPRGRAFFRVTFFLPNVVSLAVVGVLWGQLYDPLAGLQSIDATLYEAAIGDGAGALALFRHVTCLACATS